MSAEWTETRESDFNSEDAFCVQIESAAAAGWDDPAMDAYNEPDPRQQAQGAP